MRTRFAAAASTGAKKYGVQRGGSRETVPWHPASAGEETTPIGCRRGDGAGRDHVALWLPERSPDQRMHRADGAILRRMRRVGRPCPQLRDGRQACAGDRDEGRPPGHSRAGRCRRHTLTYTCARTTASGPVEQGCQECGEIHRLGMGKSIGFRWRHLLGWRRAPMGGTNCLTT